MKISFITGFYPEIGGPFTATKNLVTSLVEAGAEVSVVSPLPADYDAVKLKFAKELPFSVEYLPDGIFSPLFPSYSSLWRKKLLEMQCAFDIFNVNGIFNYYSLLAPFVLKKPYVISLHGSLLRNAYELGGLKHIKKSVFMRLVGRKIVNKASFVRVMCREEADGFLEFFPELNEKVRVIPNGINCENLMDAKVSAEWIRRYPELNGKRYLMFLGRLHPIKGLDLLVDAFALLASEKDLSLVLAGPDTIGYSKKLKKKISDLGLINRVVFTGMLNDGEIVSALKMAEIFVLSSYSENFGMVAVEAMACGVPVIVSDKVGIHREINENAAGIVVKNEAGCIAAAVRSILNNKELKSQLSRNGVKLVKDRYDSRIVAADILKMYDEALRHQWT